MSNSLNLPEIEERFLPPTNWQTGKFTNPETKHNIHYSFIYEDSNKATIVCLPGLSEFGEKYIETARFFSGYNFNIYIIDWAYQGRSSRFSKNSHKRHSDGYESDISDLNYLIDNIIGNKNPLFMLGHSMGSNIGLRYLASKNHYINAATFSTPMLGIKSLKLFPSCCSFIFKFMSEKYVFGGQNWKKGDRGTYDKDIFSSDVNRNKVHNAWCIANPILQIGNPTFKWLYESLKSINFLKSKSTLKNIKIPMILGYADKETLVDNKAIAQASSHIKNSKLIMLKNSKHEIMMETDDIRDKFLEETLELFNQ